LGGRPARRDAPAPRRDALRLAAPRRGPAAALGSAVEDTITELALEIAELAPIALEELELEAALESLAHHHRVEHGLEVRVDLSEWRDSGGPVRLEPELESTLYRAAQEGLANVAAHSRATAALVRLRRLPTEIELSVADDGRGFDPRAPSGGAGTSLTATVPA
jgi:signal transduction histidine kinase